MEVSLIGKIITEGKIYDKEKNLKLTWNFTAEEKLKCLWKSGGLTTTPNISFGNLYGQTPI